MKANFAALMVKKVKEYEIQLIEKLRSTQDPAKQEEYWNKVMELKADAKFAPSPMYYLNKKNQKNSVSSMVVNKKLS